MNGKLVFIGLIAFMVLLSGCAQQKPALQEQPAAEEPEQPSYEEPAAPAPAPEPATPPALPEVAGTASCETLLARLTEMSVAGFPTGNCAAITSYRNNFELDADEDRDLDTDDLSLAQANKGNEQWCSIRLNRTRNPCNTKYYQFPSCSSRIRGDLNGDGKVDNRDSATLSIYGAIGSYPERAGEFEFYPIQGEQCCIDADGDGTITAQDITDTLNRVRYGQKEPQKC